MTLKFASSIFFDLDGVLRYQGEMANQAYLRQDWEEFQKIQIVEKPIPYMVNLARAFASDHNIIITTAGSEEWRREIRGWLKLEDVPFDLLFTRPVGNKEPSPVLKLAMYDQYVRDFDKSKHVALIIDDREDVCNAFNARRVPALLYKGV